MTFEVEMSGEVAVVVLSEPSLDADNAQDFKDKIASTLKENPKVAFDLAAVKFLDSSGLGVLLSCLRTLKAEFGELKLIRLTKEVRDLFDRMRLLQLFEVFDTRQEALSSF